MRNPGAAKYRLKKKALIDGLFQRKSATRQSISTSSVVLIFDFVERKTSRESAPYQAAVTATRRLKRAIDRNRVKRLMREAVRAQHDVLRKLPTREDHVLIFIMVFKGQLENLDCRRDADVALERLIERISSPRPQLNGTT